LLANTERDVFAFGSRACAFPVFGREVGWRCGCENIALAELLSENALHQNPNAKLVSPSW
jgi:hypothetical protein